MHRSYQSVLPCQNKLLQMRWDKNYFDKHREKVRKVSATVDTRPPQTFMHLHLKLKKMQLEEERLAVIERDNRILLEKMSYIIRTQGRIDNRNNYEYRSLNREKRQRELMRITQENQLILRRLINRQPEYNHLKWDQDRRKNKEFISNITHFPEHVWKKQNENRKVPSTSQKQSLRFKQEKIEGEANVAGSRNSQKQESEVSKERGEVKENGGTAEKQKEADVNGPEADKNH